MFSALLIVFSVNFCLVNRNRLQCVLDYSSHLSHLNCGLTSQTVRIFWIFNAYQCVVFSIDSAFNLIG